MSSGFLKKSRRADVVALSIFFLLGASSLAGAPGGTDVTPPVATPAAERPLRQGDEFLSATRETLSYRMTYHGIPVGKAVLLARKEHGALHITWKVESLPVVSAIYPVDDEIDTRLISGNYIVTSIRQREGSFRSNIDFTLMLREKKVVFVDRLHDRFVTELLPRSDITDLISGFYLLRNQPLKAGGTLLLHIFDSGRYAPTDVEVLRREEITVPGRGVVATLVVFPRLTTAGIFRRTGDLLIWLTDDERKVPVRIETSIPLGRITAVLRSFEVER